MNQVKLSAIRDIPKNSIEFETVKQLCRMGRGHGRNETFKRGTWELYREMILQVTFTLPLIILIFDIRLKIL